MANLLKVMISQPMNGRTDDEIRATRECVSQALRRKGYEVVDSYFCNEWNQIWKQQTGEDVVNIPLDFMSRSIHVMSRCHAVCFCDGWKDARGCRIENQMAMAYGLNCIYEKDLK